MAGPWEKYGAAAEPAAPWAKYAEPEAAPAEEPAPAAKPAKEKRANRTPLIGPLLDKLDIPFDVQDVAPGLASGAASIGNTLLNVGTKAAPASVQQWNAERQAGLKDYRAERASPTFAASEFFGEAGATAPVGGIVGKTISKIPGFGALGDAVVQGGMNAARPAVPLIGRTLPQKAVELGARTMDAGTRALGGGISAGSQAALIDPDAAGPAAFIGAALPGGIRLAARGGTAAGNIARDIVKPGAAADRRAAEKIMRVAEMDPADMTARLQPVGPQIVNQQPNAVTLLENPGVSQLSRSLINAGDTNIAAGNTAMDAARTAALRRLGTPATDMPAARTKFGQTFRPGYDEALAAERKGVSQDFQAIDPGDVDVRVNLPLDEFGSVKKEFFGPGSIRTPSSVTDTVRTAQEVGTRELPAVAAAAAPGKHANGLDLFEAMKRLGGIKQDSAGGLAFKGELYDLKQSGGRGVIQNGRGQSPDTLAQAMHAQGYIPDDDPATLLNAMREHATGNKQYANTADRGKSGRAGMEAQQGDAPGAEKMVVPATWSEMQRMRRDIGAMARKAESAPGGETEAAALRKMQGELDSAVDRVAAGKGTEGEEFAPERVKAWRDAIERRRLMDENFRSGQLKTLGYANGPREGELAGKFFNGSAGQAEHIADFNRVAGVMGDAGDASRQALRDYAITDVNRLRLKGGAKGGQLSPSAVPDFVSSRGGAIRGLFGDPGVATLDDISRGLSRQNIAEDLAVSKGSATAQNVEHALSNGWLEHPALSGAIGKVPLIGKFGTAGLGALNAAATRSNAKNLGRLIANPDQLSAAIRAAQLRRGQVPLSLGLNSDAGRLGYRALPLLPLAGSDR